MITDVTIVCTDIPKAVINKAIIVIDCLTRLPSRHSVRQYFREHYCEINSTVFICLYADTRVQRSL